MASWTDKAKADPRWSQPPTDTENVHPPHVQRDIERREALRTEELEHLAQLRERVERGLNEGQVDLSSATTMLLNISTARCTLAGIGYPGAW